MFSRGNAEFKLNGICSLYFSTSDLKHTLDILLSKVVPSLAQRLKTATSGNKIMTDYLSVITAVMIITGHGYVDEEIFFSYESCQDGYCPRRWDRVKVTAVESGQGRCRWRALSVEPAKVKHIPRYTVMDMIKGVYNVQYL